MSLVNFFDVLVHSKFIESLFSDDEGNIPNPPPGSSVMITETGIDMITEAGDFMITE
jgi:hypothetical protein